MPEQAPTLECPACRGRGQVQLHVFGHRADGSHFSGPRISACTLCRGSGAITTERAALVAEGERRREDRKARRLSLREEAARLGITPQELSRIENGRESDG